MKFNTKHFGEIDYDHTKVISFDESIPGFEGLHRFILFTNKEEDENNPFCWLQSIEDGDVVFALMNVYSIMPDYNPLVEDNEIESLGSFSAGDLEIYNIVVIPEDIKELRVNLKAPIVINLKNKRAKQVILTNEEYGIRFNIFKELQNVSLSR